MSQADEQLLKSLSVSQTEVAHALDISRQAVSKGLRSERQFFDETKLRRLREALVNSFGLSADLVDHEVAHLLPSRADLAGTNLDAMGLAFEGETYVVANRFTYFRGRYPAAFELMAEVIKRQLAQGRVVLVFKSYDTMKSGRDNILNWLGPDGGAAVEMLWYTCLPLVEILSFGICGRSAGKPTLFNPGSDSENLLVRVPGGEQTFEVLHHYVTRNAKRVHPLV